MTKAKIKSYEGLHNLNVILTGLKIDEHCNKNFQFMERIKNYDIVKTIIGLLSLGKRKFSYINNFHTNTYFKDSLGLQEVPNVAELNNWIKKNIPPKKALIEEINQKLIKKNKKLISTDKNCVYIFFDKIKINKGDKQLLIAWDLSGNIILGSRFPRSQINVNWELESLIKEVNNILKQCIKNKKIKVIYIFEKNHDFNQKSCHLFTNLEKERIKGNKIYYLIKRKKILGDLYEHNNTSEIIEFRDKELDLTKFTIIKIIKNIHLYGIITPINVVFASLNKNLLNNKNIVDFWCTNLNLKKTLNGSLFDLIKEKKKVFRNQIKELLLIKNKQEDSEILFKLNTFTSNCIELIYQKETVGELIRTKDNRFNKESVQFFHKNGYVVLNDAISPDEADLLKEIILKIANYEEHINQAFYYGRENKHQRVFNLLNKHKCFRELIQSPLVLQVMEYLFARDTLHPKYVLSSFHANLIGSGGDNGILHVDSAVPSPLPPWIIRANINWLVEDYTAKNGATLCLPGSHKFNRKPTQKDQIRKDLRKIIAPKGSMVIWTGHLWHRSGVNLTREKRIGLLCCFASSFLKEMCQEEDQLQIIDKNIVKNSNNYFKSIIGFNHGIKKGAYVKTPAEVLN